MSNTRHGRFNRERQAHFAQGVFRSSLCNVWKQSMLARGAPGCVISISLLKSRGSSNKYDAGICGSFSSLVRRFSTSRSQLVSACHEKVYFKYGMRSTCGIFTRFTSYICSDTSCVILRSRIFRYGDDTPSASKHIGTPVFPL